MKIQPSQRLFILSSLLFILLFSTGILLAQHKPLWNDEIFTQTQGIEKLSGYQMLSGRLDEGNNYPLFYLFQKTLLKILGYRFPGEWRGEWQWAEPYSQMVLRLGSNLFTVSSLVLIFYFFASTYSLEAGFYALALGLSSFMTWAYWAEARPYSLWFFLTALQMVLFLRILSSTPEQKQLLWRGLLISHFLLSLTVAFGMFQIALVSALLWFSGEKAWRRYLFASIVPMGLGLFYYSQTGPFRFSLGQPLSIVLTNIPVERLSLFVFFGVYLGIQRCTGLSFMARKSWTFCLLILLLTAAVILRFKLLSVPAEKGFAVSPRHFIYLTPVGIMAASLFSLEGLIACKKNQWLWINLLIILAGTLVWRFLRTYLEILSSGTYI